MQVTYFTIYQTTNKLNGKIYIGMHKTKNLNDNYIGSGKILWYAINKYGIENFEKEILFVFNNEQEMKDKEKELVTEEFCLREDTYNLCIGGHGGFNYINSVGLRSGFETRKEDQKLMNPRAVSKLRYLRQDTEWSNNFKMQISKGLKEYFEGKEGHFKGRKHSEESKNKIKSIKGRQTGNKNSQFGTMWITNGTETKKVKNNDPIPEGWKKGRK